MADLPNREQLSIVIKDNETDIAYTLPVRPIEETQYEDGEAQVNTVNILGNGPIDLAAGVDLDQISWTSFFPGSFDESFCDISESELKDAMTYRNRFSSWKDAHTPLQLIWPWADLNKTVYLKSFAWQPPNSMGDLFYSVTFREEKTLAPKKLTPGGEPVEGLQPEDRAPLPEPSMSATYTVQAGDTLFGIAKKLGLASWREQLYEPNEATIGSDPNLISPGQVLVL